MKTRTLLLHIALVYCCSLFAYNTGSREDPFEINSLEDFLAFRDTVNNGFYDACGVLNCDIDLYTVCYQTEDTIVNWCSIGEGIGICYKGHFDGRGHCVRGLFVNSPIECYKGIFGSADSASIRNLGAEDIYFNAGYYVGGIIGTATNTTVTNCYSQGYLQGYFVSGIIGTSANCSIKNCFSSCYVKGNYNGHISGYNSSKIEHCFFNTESSSSKTSSDNATGMSVEKMMNGQLLQLLNEYVDLYLGDTLRYWDQVLFIDSFPTFSSTNLVSDIKIDTPVDGDIYNIHGIKIHSTESKLSSGIYIQKRRKFIVK